MYVQLGTQIVFLRAPPIYNEAWKIILKDYLKKLKKACFRE